MRCLHPLAVPARISIAAPTPRVALVPGLLQALKLAGDEFFEMGRYLVIGAFLASLMQTFILAGFAQIVGDQPGELGAGHGWIGVLAFGMQHGRCVFWRYPSPARSPSARFLTFLTFGPMVDIKSTMMYMGVFKRRTVVLHGGPAAVAVSAIRHLAQPEREVLAM